MLTASDLSPSGLTSRSYDLPDGTYQLMQLPSGMWAVRTPDDTDWSEKFSSRREANLAIASGALR